MPQNLILLSEGADMTALFQKEKDNLVDPVYKGKGKLPTCESFDGEVFRQLLDLEGCKGVRVYSGMDKDLNVKFVICGVNENDEDVYFPSSEEFKEQRVIELGFRCPDNCPPKSALNP